MSAIQRFAAILLADLRERSRGPRFWFVLAAMMVLAILCFPSPEASHRIFTVTGGARADYSSAWVGLVLSMAFSMGLSLGGFYLVRGTLVRDIETRVWQLLVATPMTRGGFLLAKWASHLLVFGLITVLSLVVGLGAQIVRAEDAHIDLIELLKPALLLSLPAFAFTSMLAVWFDLLPWLRRTAGNVLFFVLWMVLVSVSVARMESPGSVFRTGWVSDPAGLVLVARDLHRVREAQTGKAQGHGFTLGSPNEGNPPNFEWKTWDVRPLDAVGRALWLIGSLLGVLAAAPLLDWAASRGLATRRRSGSGRRLRWLDRLLAPIARLPLGALVTVEAKSWLRDRAVWWWALATLSLGLQAFASPKVMAVGLLLAWALPLDLLSRIGLQERERRTGALVFTAPGIVWRLLAARFLVGFGVTMALTIPAMLRLPAIGALAAVVIAASIASWGLALGTLVRNARLFELLLLGGLYAAVQGAALFDVGDSALATLRLHGLGLLPAWAMLAFAWPRFARA